MEDQYPPTRRFFSIIVPAYNEEKLIARTMQSLSRLSYPENQFEILIIENGSSDRTFAEAKKHEAPNCHVYHLEQKGVSRARNFGIAHRSIRCDWAILLDADTYLGENFLKELSAYLDSRPKVSFGTTEVRLDDTSVIGLFWTWYLNMTDRLMHVLHRIHIVRNDLIEIARYEEDLVATEDLRFGRLLSEYGGAYFFMPTREVVTSARRFKTKGYLRMFFVNIWYGMITKSRIRNMPWESVR